MTDPTPVEARAREHLASRNLPRMLALMDAQHAKGRIEYGHPIDEWPAERDEAVREAAKELADLITYLERAGGFAEAVFSNLRVVAIVLEGEMKQEEGE